MRAAGLPCAAARRALLALACSATCKWLEGRAGVPPAGAAGFPVAEPGARHGKSP